jgi:chemotaxis protein CheC
MKLFTEAGLKELEKMAHKGAKSASESLSKLISQNAKVTAVKVRALEPEHVIDTIGQPEDLVTTIVMKLSGEVRGEIMLIYPQQSALNIVDFMAKRPLGSTSSMSLLGISALKESGNILAGAFLSAITDYLHINMLESVPDLASDMLKATVDSIISTFIEDELTEAIVMEINFGMESTGTEAVKVVPNIKTEGYFVLLLNAESAKKVMSSLKGISGGKKMTNKV